MKEILITLTKANDFLAKHEKGRKLVGVAICIASILLLILNEEYGMNVLGAFPSIFTSVTFCVGLIFISNSLEKLSVGMLRLGIELIAFFAFAISFYFCYTAFICYVDKDRTVGIGMFLLTFVAMVYYFAYVFRVATGLFSLVKKAITTLSKKTNADDVNKATKKLEEFLKNVVSIAGTLGIIYTFLEPFITKIFGK